MKSGFFATGLIIASISCHCVSKTALALERAADQTQAAADQDRFTLGVALKSEGLSGPNLPLITANFNRITAEYEMKWAPLMKGGSYDFTAADSITAFARQHQMHLSGHALIWHIDTPSWVFLGKGTQPTDRETLRNRMKNHITTTVKHFKGQIDNWDVVNEALSDESGIVYRQSPFFKIFGNEDYIVDAFRFAQEADPEVELWYNDYVLESPAKLEKLLTLIRRLKAEHIKITGIGFQGHYSLGWPGVGLIENAFNAVIAQGLKVKISELDITIYDDYNNGVYTPEAAKPCDSALLYLQARRYSELFQLFRRYKAHIAHVTMWGLKDDSSWLNETVPGRQDCPLLIDAEGQPKPAFYAAFPKDQY